MCFCFMGLIYPVVASAFLCIMPYGIFVSVFFLTIFVPNSLFNFSKYLFLASVHMCCGALDKEHQEEVNIFNE